MFNLLDIDTPTLSETEVETTKESFVNVECNAKGRPQPSVEWRKNGEFFRAF